MTMPEDDNPNHIRAYVLIDTEPEMTRSVVRSLRTRRDISLADIINGPFNAIAVVEGDSASAVAGAILVGIRRLKGVRDVIVYLATHETKEATVFQAGDADSAPGNVMARNQNNNRAYVKSGSGN
jgi:hypothetical protein